MAIPRGTSAIIKATPPSLEQGLYSPSPGILPCPRDIGVLGQFDSWRAWQEAAILTSMDASTRVVIECLPTGAGKTLIYMAEAIMNGGKAVILTSTKGQQDQIVDSFRPMVDNGTIVDIRGQQNYRCDAVRAGGEYDYLNPTNEWCPVAEGPCHDGAVCGLKDDGCGYYDKIRKAKAAKIVVTNYAFWMTNAKMEVRWQLETPDLLICDEAHEAVNQVCGFLAQELDKEDLQCITSVLGINVPSMIGVEVAAWRDWASYANMKANERLEEDRQHRRLLAADKKRLKTIQQKLQVLAVMALDNWVVETDRLTPTTIHFDPVWPHPYAEALLFRGARKVILSSATVRMKDAELLGLARPTEEGTRSTPGVTMFESPSTFSPKRRPIYRIPCMRMNHKTEGKEGSEAIWTGMIGRIMTETDTSGRSRRMTNGIVHTTSYKRRDVIAKRLGESFGHMMISHGKHSSDVQRAVDELRLHSGRVLISPSITTGYDFPYDAARWQVIPKLPIPDTRAAVMKRRYQEDREYGPHMTATALQQMTGRIDRAEDDWGETFITDDNVVWFVRKWGRRLFTDWWLEAYQDWGQTMEWARGKLPGVCDGGFEIG